MKKTTQVLLICLTFNFYSCADLEKKPVSKDQLITKLEKFESDLTDQILEMEKESKEAGEKAKKDISSTIQKLKSEKKKIQRLARKTAKSSEKDLQEINENLESLQKELHTFSDKLQKEIKRLKEEK